MKIWGAAVEFEVLFKLGGVAVGVESDQVVPRGQLVPSVIGFQGFAVLELDVVSIRRLVIEFGRLPYILDAGPVYLWTRFDDAFPALWVAGSCNECQWRGAGARGVWLLEI